MLGRQTVSGLLLVSFLWLPVFPVAFAEDAKNSETTVQSIDFHPRLQLLVGYSLWSGSGNFDLLNASYMKSDPIGYALWPRALIGVSSTEYFSVNAGVGLIYGEMRNSRSYEGGKLSLTNHSLSADLTIQLLFYRVPYVKPLIELGVVGHSFVNDTTINSGTGEHTYKTDFKDGNYSDLLTLPLGLGFGGSVPFNDKLAFSVMLMGWSSRWSSAPGAVMVGSEYAL